MRNSEAAIGAKMRGPGDPAGRRGRAHDLALLDKRSKELHTDFEPNAAVPINGDVATSTCLLRAYGGPDQAAALRHHAREL
jgi:hypothetical protein